MSSEILDREHCLVVHSSKDIKPSNSQLSLLSYQSEISINGSGGDGLRAFLNNSRCSSPIFFSYASLHATRLRPPCSLPGASLTDS